MKKHVVVLLALVLATTPLIGLGEQEYFTIGELREQAQANWTQTYETKWRDVEIDAPILLPDTDVVPVLEAAFTMSEPLLTAAESGWDEVEADDRGLVLSNRGKEVPRSVNGKRINKNPEAKDTWHSGFAPEDAYVPMSDITFGEICELIRGELVRFGYDENAFEIEAPTELWAQHWFYYGYKEDALPGHIYFSAYQKLYGLPLLGHIQKAVSDHVNGESSNGPIMHEIWVSFGLRSGYDAYDKQLNILNIRAAKPTRIIADDVPLCSLDKVKATVEKEIVAGHIRKIFEVRLGYAYYNELGAYREKGKEPDYETARFYLKPMWQVNCLYVRNATGELRETASYTMDERNTLDYYELLVDAQTGELVGESQAQDRCEFKGFLSWEDVGGKR